MRVRALWFLGLGFLGCAVENQDEADVASRAGFEDLGEATQELVVCAPDNAVRGLDVSYYQGDINWTAVAQDGWSFAIARINHGNFMDPKFDENYAGIKAAGMIRGSYQYFDPGGDVVAQAQIVIDKIGQLGPGDLPTVLDVESTDGLNPAQMADAIETWLALVEPATGKTPIIYTGKYFWQDNVGSAAFSDYPLWHAQYPNACLPPNPPPPACGCANIADQWGTWKLWQYTSTGAIPGISGNVDKNVFNGSLEDLIAFASGGGYAAEFISLEAPQVVVEGEVFDVAITLENIGGKPWTANTLLGTTEPRDRASVFQHESWVSGGRVAPLGDVAPGATTTLTVKFRAPAAGVYTESFGLVEELVTWFGDQGGPPDTAITLAVQVVEAPPNGSGGSGPGPNGSGGGPSDGGAASNGGATGDGGGVSDGDGDADDDGCGECSIGSRRDQPWLGFLALGLLGGVRRRARTLKNR